MNLEEFRAKWDSQKTSYHTVYAKNGIYWANNVEYNGDTINVLNIAVSRLGRDYRVQQYATLFADDILDVKPGSRGVLVPVGINRYVIMNEEEYQRLKREQGDERMFYRVGVNGL